MQITLWATRQSCHAIRISHSAIEGHPFWRGVKDECEQLEQDDLVDGLYMWHQAEDLAQKLEIASASRAYERATQQLLLWRHRKVVECREPFIDDMELLLDEPIRLGSAGDFVDAVNSWRVACREALAGFARVYTTPETRVIRVRGPHFESLRRKHEDCVALALEGRLDEVAADCAEVATEYGSVASNYATDPDWRLCEAWSRYNLASVLQASGRNERAEQEYARALCAIRAVAVDEWDPIGQADLANFYAGCSDNRFQNREEALRLASRAVELASGDTYCQLTLGHVLSAMGRWKSAADAYQRAHNICVDREEEYAVFYLAAAHAQLGLVEVARAEYQNGLRLMQARLPGSRYQRQWDAARSAAEQSLGMAPPIYLRAGVLYPPPEWQGDPLLGQDMLGQARRSTSEGPECR